MRLAILGATGRTGRLLLARALEDGHEVRALARRPAALGDGRHERLTIVEGDARDAAAVRETVGGSEAVLSALGPVKDSGSDLLSAAARATVEAAAAQGGVQRVVWLTGAGVGAEGDEPKVVDRVFVNALKLFQRKLLEDSVTAVETIRGSGLESTIVRAPRLVDGPVAADPYVGSVGPQSGTRVSRATVAGFMLREATEPRHAGGMPVISER